MNIWVLGEGGTNADKHIDWAQYLWPNFSDFDVLIINLGSLSKHTLEYIDSEKILQSQKTILERLLHGGIVIIITSTIFSVSNHHKKGYTFDNYCLSPIHIETQNVTEGTELKYPDDHLFSSYLKYVKKFKFIFTANAKYHTRFSDTDIKDKANHDLGCGFMMNLGRMFFLPPVTEGSTKDAINKIIEVYKKSTITNREPPPEWIAKVNLFGMSTIDNKIQELTQNKLKIETDLSKTIEEKKILENYYGLLYLQNAELEDCVQDAFKLLGFDEIKRIRSDELEDWVIDLPTINGVDHGIIEVKGRNAKTSQADIVQCNKWVDDYHLMTPPKTVKGILVSNQFRLEDFSSSKEKRTKFEPNEIKYAQGREICIIPSYVLFESVNKVLEGKGKSREEIEKLIFETNGVLQEI